MAVAACVTVVLAASGTVGCVSIHQPARFAPAPQREWPETLAAAQADAAQGNYDLADTTLARFAMHFPGTPQALETAYWRALYGMDPSNRAASLPTAMASLDAYLADERPGAHATEAAVLRRLAGQIDGLNKLAANSMAQVKETVATKSAGGDVRSESAKAGGASDAQGASDAEIKRLKEELAKANAELERIKRRLAQPPPPA